MPLTYPRAVVDYLGDPTDEPPMYAHDILCLHTMVGSLAGTNSMFHANGFGGTESHYGLGENATQGTKNWQRLDRTADANLNGNGRVVALETADYGGTFGTWNTNDASQVPAWNAWQCEEVAHWLAWHSKAENHRAMGCPSSWACTKVGIPLELIPDTKPGRRGVAYHQQGCDPVRVSGGELWSSAYGKVCPGRRRIEQIPSIIARARAIAAGHPDQEDDDMPMTEGEKDEIVRRVTDAVSERIRDLMPRVFGAVFTGRANTAYNSGVRDDMAGRPYADVDPFGTNGWDLTGGVLRQPTDDA